MFGVATSALERPGRAFTLQLHKTTAEVETVRRASAERAATEMQPVPPEVLQAQLRLLLADMSPVTTVMRFFACATGRQSPHDAVVADFKRIGAASLDATGGAPGGAVTAPVMEAALRKALADVTGAATAGAAAGAAGAATAGAAAVVVAAAAAATTTSAPVPLPQAHRLLIDAERASFAAMDLDSDGALSIEEYMGGFVGFERALHSLMVAADADPRDQRISERELRAVKREDVVQALLGFAAHIPQERRKVAVRRAEL
jgi:hypothetical protein